MEVFKIGRPDSAQTEATKAPKYYRHSISSGPDQNAFQDLDDPAVLRKSIEAISSSFTRNFVLDFSDDDAWVGFDLAAESVAELVKAEARPGELNTRWINIWYPYHQQPLLACLGKHFDFSPRLLALINSDPRRTGLATRASLTTTLRNANGKTTKSISLSDLETGSNRSGAGSMKSNNPVRTGNVYDIADEIWHYTSVDQGRNCK